MAHYNMSLLAVLAIILSCVVLNFQPAKADYCTIIETASRDFTWYKELRGLMLRFQVQARENAVVRLYVEYPSVEKYGYYEILISDTVVSITNMSHPSTSVKASGNFLDETRYLDFWIKKENGSIELGNGTTSEDGFLKLEDPEIAPVNYFNFPAAGDSNASWKYCPQGSGCIEFNTDEPHALEAISGTSSRLNFILFGSVHDDQNALIQLSERSYPGYAAVAYTIEIEHDEAVCIYKGSHLLKCTPVSKAENKVRWIDVTSKQVQVGSGNDTVIAEGSDETPLSVSYFSFAGGTTYDPVYWYTDCPRKNAVSEECDQSDISCANRQDLVN